MRHLFRRHRLLRRDRSLGRRPRRGRCAAAHDGAPPRITWNSDRMFLKRLLNACFRFASRRDAARSRRTSERPSRQDDARGAVVATSLRSRRGGDDAEKSPAPHTPQRAACRRRAPSRPRPAAVARCDGVTTLAVARCDGVTTLPGFRPRRAFACVSLLCCSRYAAGR